MYIDLKLFWYIYVMAPTRVIHDPLDTCSSHHCASSHGLGCMLIGCLFLLFSSPELKTHKVSLWYSKALLSIIVIRRRCPSSSLSNKNISNTSWPVFSSPELKAHCWAYSIGRHSLSLVVCQLFQTTSPLKPWSRFFPYFTYSIYMQRERIIVFFVPIE